MQNVATGSKTIVLTGDPLAPSYYVMAAALASSIAVLFVQARHRAPALA